MNITLQAPVQSSGLPTNYQKVANYYFLPLLIWTKDLHTNGIRFNGLLRFSERTKGELQFDSEGFPAQERYRVLVLWLLFFFIIIINYHHYHCT